MEFLKDLNDQQKAAVLHKENVILVACPGSGKTRVLTSKIAYELDQLSDQRTWILGLTYTIRAADEIARRIDAMSLAKDKVWIGTIHSFCLEWILRPYAGYHERLKNGFELIDESQAEELLSKAKLSLGTNSDLKVNVRFDLNGNCPNENILSQKVALKYHELLKEQKLIDFDLVLFLANELLNSVPPVAKILANLFKWVCIDEYQDTQELQYSIVGKVLRAGNGRYFIVGDPNQSIYHNLGAAKKAFDEIETIFGSSAARFALIKCYRSTQRVINFYTNFQQTPMSVTSSASYAEEQGKIVYKSNISRHQISSYIGKLVAQTLSEGTPQSEICIVAPAWWLVSQCAKDIRQSHSDLKFDSVGKSVTKRHQFNPWYKITLLLFLPTSPRRSLYKLRLSREVIEDLQLSLGQSLPLRYQDPRHFLNLLNSLKSQKSKLIPYILECFSELEGVLNISIGSLSVLQQLKETYLNSLQTLQSKGQLPEGTQEFRLWYHDNEGIVISSCHGLKGEEYDTVIAFGLLQGYVPHQKEIESDPLSAENNAKKLLYVICSRAKRNLYLISETGRTQNKQLLLSTELLSRAKFEYDTF